MRQDNHGFLVAECARGYSLVRFGILRTYTAQAHQPQTPAIPLEGNGAIAQNRQTVAHQIAIDITTADHHVMVTQRGIAERTPDCTQKRGAFRHVAKSESLVGFFIRPSQRTISYEIPGKHHDVRLQGVDVVNYRSEKEAFGEFEVMDVTDLRNPNAAKTIWKARKVDGILFDTQVMTRDFACIECKATQGCPGKRKKRSAREMVR